MKKMFLFDLDDTLIYNLHDYSWPQIEFIKFVLKRIGPKAPDVPTIINTEVKEDVKLVNEWMTLNKAFSKERFPTSFKRAYREICKTLKMTDLEGEKIAYEIGTDAFSTERWKKQGLIPGAKEYN